MNISEDAVSSLPIYIVMQSFTFPLVPHSPPPASPFLPQPLLLLRYCLPYTDGPAVATDPPQSLISLSLTFWFSYER